MRMVATEPSVSINATIEVDLFGQFGVPFAFFERPQWDKFPGAVSTYAADTLKKSITLTNKPMKQAVIAPSMLALLYPLFRDATPLALSLAASLVLVVIALFTLGHTAATAPSGGVEPGGAP